MIELIKKKISDLSNKLSALNAAKFSVSIPYFASEECFSEHKSVMDKYQKSIDITDAQIEVLKDLKETIKKEETESSISASELCGKSAQSAFDSTLEFLDAINKMTTVKRFSLAESNSLKRSLDKKLDEMHKTERAGHKAYAKQMQDKYSKK